MRILIHLGDITKIDGAKIPVVDVITGGSPCQDLSVAGKREGLSGERSGLFMEQIRVIKEMREHDRSNGRTSEYIRPRYMVWENVPGALSSNGGEDFRIVLEETAKIADSDAVIPRFEGGAWKTSGCIVADGWSVAWRVHNSQFWGVPQRRTRLALVADFNGQSAPEILFERKGLSRNFEPSREARESSPGRIGRDIENAEFYTLADQGGGCMTVNNGVASTLRASVGGHSEIVIEPRSKDGEPRINKGVSPTLNTSGGGQRQPCVIQKI